MATTPKIKAALSTLQQNHALPSEDWQPEPAPETPEIPEAPEDMVETPTPPARIWEIKVCAYKGQSSAGPMVWFIFPPDARDHIRQTYQRVTLQKLDEEHWQITKGGYRKFSKYDKKIKLTYTDPGIEPFGSSAAEAVEANGEILIYLAKENRVPIAQLTGVPKSAPPQPPQMKKPAPKPVPPIRLKADPAPPVDSPPVQHVKVTMQQPMLMTTSTLMEQRMYDIIRQVYDIQELCPYRLVILADGRLVWRAPEIG